MAKQKPSKTLFGLGLAAVAASLAYTRMTPEQKKKLSKAKDSLLEKAGSQVDSTADQVKDVTDSIVEEGGRAADTVRDEVDGAKATSKTSLEDVITVVESTLKEAKKYLKK